MKLTVKKELRAKSITELNKQLLDARNEQRVMKLDRQMGKLKNTSELKTKRVEIAVVNTILNEKLVEEKFANTDKPEGKKEVSVKGKTVDGKTKGVKKAKAKSTIKKTASVKTTAVKGGKK